MGLLLFDAWICDRFHFHRKLPFEPLAGSRLLHLEWHIGDEQKDMSRRVPVCCNPRPLFVAGQAAKLNLSHLQIQILDLTSKFSLSRA
jgi:hypothetical protein